MPKVCIGVPIFNEDKYIEQTLLSLKKQNYEDVQFIVSDNASDDLTWDICQDVANGDKRFVLERQSENIGALENGKQIFLKSDSEYFMWLGGHDYISNNYISASVELLDNDSSLSIVSGIPYAVTHGTDDMILENAIYKFTQKKLGRYLQSIRELRNCTIVNSLFRRAALNGFEFRSTRAPDMVLLSRILWHGQLEYMPNEIYYRRYFDSRSNSYEERIVGRSCQLSYYDLIRYYLDDFSSIYTGDERMKRYIENEIVAILSKRHGVQCLIPNDGV